MAASEYALVDPFPELPLIRSVTKIYQPPGRPGRWYVLEQRGTVIAFDTDAPEAAFEWLDFSSAVRGPAAGRDGRLLGIDFHPQFDKFSQVFVYYTGDYQGTFSSVVLRIDLDNVDRPVSPGKHTILTLPQTGPTHKGGDVRIGPDGHLYLALGDGGSGSLDVRSHDPSNWYGALLRVKISGDDEGYDIPGGNPFSGNPSCASGQTGMPCPEVYAWGFRNPFRWTFDSSQKLWVADVGDERREEVNLVQAGLDYGWPCEEGSLPFKDGVCDADDPLQRPVYEYSHDNGDVSITGGFVYTGTAFPELQGRYIFGDFLSGRLWALDDGTNGDERSAQLLIDSDALIVSIEPGADGEIYIGDRSKNRILRLEPQTSGAKDTIPRQLVDTGCFDAKDPTTTAEGVLPYALNAPFWSDGAEKDRYFAIPDGSTIDVVDGGDWEFPEGSVLIKNFRLGGKLIETRLLMRHTGGDWRGYTWEWNVEQTKATRVIGGKVRNVGGIEWLYPSENQCLICHTSVAGRTIGPEIAQLNRDLDYPAPVSATGNQIDLLDEMGYLTNTQPPSTDLPALADPADASGDLGERARAWLHSNCASCHRPDGPTPSSMDLRYDTALSATNACSVLPANDLGLPNALIIAPGEPSRSVLLERISVRGRHQMPPLGSTVVDSDAVSLIGDWITDLQNCD